MTNFVIEVRGQVASYRDGRFEWSKDWSDFFERKFVLLVVPIILHESVLGNAAWTDLLSDASVILLALTDSNLPASVKLSNVEVGFSENSSTG